jgi:hypothetical protein
MKHYIYHCVTRFLLVIKKSLLLLMIGIRSIPSCETNISLCQKKKHVNAVKGLQQFLHEFTAERTIGQEGYLIGNGFSYLDEQRRNMARNDVLSLSPLER